MIRHVLRFLFLLLPATRMFAVKRFVLKLCGIRVGDRTRITGGFGLYGRGLVEIGSDCWIGLNSRMYVSEASEVVIGNRCDIAPDVIFHSGTHQIGTSTRRAGHGMSAHIRIGNGVWIGTRVTVLAGCTVGDGSIVAGGAVLLGKNYPGDVLLAGVPAKIVKTLSKE